jgi:hypothetical protein
MSRVMPAVRDALTPSVTRKRDASAFMSSGREVDGPQRRWTRARPNFFVRWKIT